MSNRCQAYVERGGMLVAGGKDRRHRHCKRPATTTRSKDRGHWGGAITLTYDLCGQHAAQWDKAERGEGLPPRLRSDW